MKFRTIALSTALALTGVGVASAEPVDDRTEVLVQVCEPDLWVSVWRDDGVLDSIGIQWPNSRYDSRTRPAPVRVNGVELNPANYVWGESAWFTTVQSPIDADSVLVQYGQCGAMIAEDGEVMQAPSLAFTGDFEYAADVETGTTPPLVQPAPTAPRGEFAGRVLKTG